MNSTTRNMPILYPKHLNTYVQCPERYYHERVTRRKVLQPLSPALARGIAVHQVLSQAANAHPSGLSDLAGHVESTLSRAPYPNQEAWERDLRALVTETQYGITLLDAEARVLATEVTYHYPFKGNGSCPPFVLAAKVDAVLLRHDVVGRPYLDIVDWKGGSARHDSIQELACRIVVQHNAHRFNVNTAFIQSTTVYLGAKITQSSVITPPEGRQRWGQMMGIASAILAGTDWAPNPSPLCEWCPYFINGCTVTASANENNVVETWLGAVAS